MSTHEPAPKADAVDQSVALDQTFDIDGLYSLRSALVAHASELGLVDGQLDRLTLVGSELATNAVRHGGGTGRIRLWLADGAVFCEVSDRGAGIADPDVGTVKTDPAAMGGRGIWICRQLSDTFTIVPGKPGAVVTVSINVPAP